MPVTTRSMSKKLQVTPKIINYYAIDKNNIIYDEDYVSSRLDKVKIAILKKEYDQDKDNDYEKYSILDKVTIAILKNLSS
jgi:hypothetical protein